jgi:hypothetical protein
MCEECEEVDVLREVYLARRARMARTWQPKGPKRWNAELVVADGASALATDARPKLIAAE